MNCDLCQDLIQQRLDGLEPADPALLEGHLHDCPACRSLHAAAISLQHGLRLLTPQSPPDALTDRVASRLLADYRTRMRWRRGTAWAALAASALLMLSAYLWWRGTVSVPGTPFDPNPLAKELPRKGPDELPEPLPAPAGVRESMSEVGSAMAQVAARTADATVAESRHFLPLLPAPALPKLQLPSPPSAPTQVLREAGEGVSGALAPITDSPRRALDLFLRDLPMNLDEKMGL